MDSVARYNQVCDRVTAPATRQLSDDLDMHPDEQATPGPWEHYTAFAPPWLSILSRLDN